MEVAVLERLFAELSLAVWEDTEGKTRSTFEYEIPARILYTRDRLQWL